MGYILDKSILSWQYSRSKLNFIYQHTPSQLSSPGHRSISCYLGVWLLSGICGLLPLSTNVTKSTWALTIHGREQQPGERPNSKAGIRFVLNLRVCLLSHHCQVRSLGGEPWQLYTHGTHKGAQPKSAHHLETCSFTSVDTPSLYPECNVNPPDGQYALLQDCERRGGPPPLSPPKRPPVLGQAGATVMGREKQQAAKDVTNTTPLSARRWSISHRGCCCLSPTWKMPVEAKLPPHPRRKFTWGSQLTATSPVSLCWCFKSPGWWRCLCWLSWGCPRQAFLLDAIESWFGVIWNFICLLLPSFTFACYKLNYFTHWKLKVW